MDAKQAAGGDARATPGTATEAGRPTSDPASQNAPAAPADPDEHRGALEGDRPDQAGQGNRNLPALDENGQPRDWQKICEDAIGANVDESEGG